jgi:hypothetical protein
VLPFGAQGAAKSMGQLVNNKTSSARLYSLLTAAIAGAGAAYMFLPDTSLSVLAQRTCSGLCGGQPLGPDVMVSWSTQSPM